MNARTTTPRIRMVNCALDETPKKEIVLRGVIAMDSLAHLQVDDYQREAAPLTALSSITDALEEGETLPDIELGMRGENWKDGKGDGEVILSDSVYIIDGFQRVNGSLHFLAKHPEGQVRLGATVHFGTTKEWERDRFRILNTLRRKVSPNVILRNCKDESSSVAMLISLSTSDKGFPLIGRVSWNDRMNRGDILSALTFAKVVGYLHAHKAPTRRINVEELVPALDKAVDIFGPQNMRSNVREFFNLIDECWGLKRIQYREGAPYVKGTFLHVLARLVSDHHDFWRHPDERVLTVEASLRRKIGQFPINDPQVSQLASSGGKSREMLYMLMRDHINSGKRTRRLRSRNGDIMSLSSNDEDSE